MVFDFSVVGKRIIACFGSKLFLEGFAQVIKVEGIEFLVSRPVTEMVFFLICFRF